MARNVAQETEEELHFNEDENPRSGFIIVFAGMAFSGYIMGILTGFMLWH